MIAYLFPGQGAQFPGMGQALSTHNPDTARLFGQADEILGFPLTELMCHGTAEDLRQTRITQPAIFVYSVALSRCMGRRFCPQAAAGHSLGEFSALTACGALSFEQGLQLVAARARAMQSACELTPGGMAAVIGLADEEVESVCNLVNDGVVVAANYNCPGQVVVSGDVAAVAQACTLLKEAGARMTVSLEVGGAFHSPLMAPAAKVLKTAVEQAHLSSPICPIYQNVSARQTQDPEVIRENLLAQLTGAVRWTQSLQNMFDDGISTCLEVGPGTVLAGLVKKTNRSIGVESAVCSDKD
jgi:[acyl-carrier-protein] S-malonyltransferase